MTSSPSDVRGSTRPRLYTKPLRKLTRETSLGYDVVDFAKSIGRPLDPWQREAVIRAMEMLPDGRPRFKKILILVARQNGKTELLVILTAYWMFIERVALILGTSTKTDYAKESLQKLTSLVESTPSLKRRLTEKRWYRLANGSCQAWVGSSRYKIAASNDQAGRSLTIHRLILDELRQHHHYAAWDAAVPATNAVAGSQVWAISNMGGDDSVVLNDIRTDALRAIEENDTETEIGLFEWSAPEGADPEDLIALGQANPNMGNRIDARTLLGDARRAKRLGGAALAGFVTEVMCSRVKHLDPPIDLATWRTLGIEGTLEEAVRPLALCLDVSLDAQHATLAVAGLMAEGQVRIKLLQGWSGHDAATQLWDSVPTWLGATGAKKVGWFPNGPAAALGTKLKSLKLPGVEVSELKAETTAVCMGFAQLVKAGEVLHSNDPLLNAHVEAADKVGNGDAWRFTRKNAGHCDALYAAAGAAHLAQTMPVPRSAKSPRGLKEYYAAQGSH